MKMLDILVVVVIILAVIFAIAIVRRQVLTVIESFFRMVLSPITVAERSLQNLWGRIRQFYRQQLAGEGGRVDGSAYFL